MSEVHIGRNIRAIRLLQDIKQGAFAQKMGIAQQNVSKLEAQKKVSARKLQAAAEALGVTVEAIETFNEKTVLQAVPDQPMPQITAPIKEIIAYFKEEIAKRDELIDQLRSQLDKITSISSML
ncbi:MAG: helix-turn-helix transcriptional regulator [Chitinophagaceae bacterium]|nr:helix-turn-helix transcriptional regulator [Chitinophagaceae bacterium]